MGSSVLVWYWPHQVGGSSPRPPRLFRASWGRLSFWCHSTGTSVSLFPLLSLGVFTLTWSALVVIASSTKVAPGVVAKVCLSLSLHLSSSLASFPVPHLVWSSSVTIPQHFSNSTSRSPSSWVAQCFSCRSSSLGAWHWRCTPSTLLSDVHSLCLVACVPWTTLPLALQTLPVSSDSVRPCKAHGRIGARPLFDLFQSHILATLAFLWVPSFGRPTLVLSRSHSSPGPRPAPQGLQPWLRTCMACVSMSLLTTSSLPGRIRFTWGHDLSSTGRPSRHRLGPSSCLFCNDVDGSLVHHLSSCPAHINARAAWAHSCGVSPSDVPVFARHGWNPLDESNRPQTIRAHIRFVRLVCERLQPLSW